MSGGFGDQASQFSGSGSDQPPPRKKKSAAVWILLVLGLGGGLVLLVCCGGMGFLSWTGMKMAGQQMAAKVQHTEAVQEHIGDIQSSTINFTATTKAQQESGNSQAIVFDLKGTKGNGKLIATAQGENLLDATLELPSGELIPLPVN
ncbi:MAG: hypothetical protein J5I93_29670 [Pirellulaceae bacterium]|nr:hypothetical protein [Pirellulaceae bacterium]